VPLPGPIGAEGAPTIRVLIASGPAISVSTTGAYQILGGNLLLGRSDGPLGPVTIRRAGRAWSVGQSTLRGDRLTLRPVGRSYVRVGKTCYRGSIVLSADARGNVLTVNHLSVEHYLAGVLSRELYPNWHRTTYEAQAIAARTYALYEKATVGPGRPYDLRDDQSSQVYGGFTAETDKAWRAAHATHGVVLATGEPGREKIFRAHYCSCCGGVTNSVYVLYGPRVDTGPLSGQVICDDCRPSPRRKWPMVAVDKAAIHHALAGVYPQAAALKSVKTVEVVERCDGRPVWIDVVGATGRRVRIRAEDLRLALLRDPASGVRRLYSMNCDIRDVGGAIVFVNGRGFGHGVGTCQWGAQGKACRGLSADQILRIYYPGAKLFKAY